MTELYAEILPLEAVKDLAPRWTALAEHLNAPLFLSWPWIETAIETASNPVYIAEIANAEDMVVGYALFGAVIETRNGIVRSRQLRLNETGAAADKTVKIEYNRLLVDPALESEAWEALLDALYCNPKPHWDEIVVNYAFRHTQTLLEAKGARICPRAEDTSAFVNLAELRAGGASAAEDYLATLGRSTRSQIRRSIRLYEEQGAIKLDRAKTLEEAKVFFAALAHFHEAKWAAQGKPGLLTDKHLWDFHTSLIERTFENGGVELLCISAGGEPIGFLYNLIDGGAVRYYLGGFRPEEDKRLKPGLVSQTFAIANHLSGDMMAYDFMAGADRYKINLGVSGAGLASFAIQRQRPSLLIEGAGRWVKTRLRGGGEHRIVTPAERVAMKLSKSADLAA